MSAELNPCPFCGNAEILMYPNDVAECGRQMAYPYRDACYGHCDGCGADGPVEMEHFAAVEAWNRRATPASTTAEDVRDAGRFVWWFNACSTDRAAAMRNFYGGDARKGIFGGEIDTWRKAIDAAITAAAANKNGGQHG